MKSTHSSGGEMLDPVAAYDLVAPVYARLSDERRAYLDGRAAARNAKRRMKVGQSRLLTGEPR